MGEFFNYDNAMLLSIADTLNLNQKERDMFLHDINNLRGEEWLPDIERYCNPVQIEDFKEIIHYEEIEK